MKTTKSRCVCLVAVLTAFGLAAHAQTYTNFTTIDDPLAVPDSLHGTFVEGIAGNMVVGYYYDSLGRHGFFHTLGTTNYTTLDDPAGVSNGSSGTGAYGISGDNITGYYSDAQDSSGTYGFIYNISAGNYTTLTDPAGVNEGVSSTEAFAINGNNVVGTESDRSSPGSVYGFLHASNSYTAFYIPIPSRINSSGGFYTTNYLTRPYGISGNNVVGTFADLDNGANPGFIYNLSTDSFMILTNPAGAYIFPYGIDGNNITGFFADPNNNYYDSGFLYTIGSTNFITVRDPLGIAGTFAQGISGQAIVGYYRDASDITHGFVVGTPTVSVSPPVISRITMIREIDVVLGGTKTAFVVTGTNGVSGAACALLNATNLVLPLSQWTALTTNLFDATGSCLFTNSPPAGMPQLFYRLSEAQ